MQSESTRAAVYTRVSSDRQEFDGSSLETQLASCLAYAAEHGYTVIGTYSDTHTGSQYRERTGLSELRARIHAGEVDVVIAHALDRLSRNQAHIAIIVEECSDHGTRIELVTEDFEDSAVGRFIVSARAFAAEVEREKIIERSVRGRKARAESGKIIPGNKPPYGYEWNADRSALLVHAEQAVIVRRIYREALAGHSLRAIGRGLERDGIPSPGGAATWWPSTVRRILTDPHYTGQAYALRWQYDERGRKQTGRHLDLEQAVALPAGTIPALVDAETQQAIIRRLEQNKRAAPRNNTAPEASLLRAGFAWCALCHTPLVVSNNSNKPAGQYRCRAPLADRRLHYLAISRDQLDRGVWEQVRAFMLRTDVLEEIVATIEPEPNDATDLQHVEKALAALDRQRNNLAASIAQASDPDTVGVLVGQLDQLAARRREIEREREALSRAVEQAAISRQMLEDLNTWRATMAENIDDMTYDDRRALLAQLGVKVYVWPADRQPRWHITSDRIPDIVFHRSDSAVHNEAFGRVQWPELEAAD